MSDKKFTIFKNISDDKVEFYCDNRLAAIDDLDNLITEIKTMRTLGQIPLYERLDKLVEQIKEDE